MKFDKNHPKLTAYALGELPPQEMAEVAQLLQKDPELAQEVESIRQLSMQMTEMLASEAMPKLSERRRTELERKFARHQRLNFSWQKVSVFTVPLLAAFVAFLYVEKGSEILQREEAAYKDAQTMPESVNEQPQDEAADEPPRSNAELEPVSRRPSASKPRPRANSPRQVAKARQKSAAAPPSSAKQDDDKKETAAKAVEGVNLGKLGIGVGKVLPRQKQKQKRDGTKAGRRLGGSGGSYMAESEGQGNHMSSDGSSDDDVAPELRKPGGANTGLLQMNSRPRIRVMLASNAVRVTAGLTSAEVLAVNRANLNQIRVCYENLWRQSPGIKGSLEVRWEIKADGSVGVFKRTGGSITDVRTSKCVEGKIQRWKYPKPRGTDTVIVSGTYRFLGE